MSATQRSVQNEDSAEDHHVLQSMAQAALNLLASDEEFLQEAEHQTTTHVNPHQRPLSPLFTAIYPHISELLKAPPPKTPNQASHPSPHPRGNRPPASAAADDTTHRPTATDRRTIHESTANEPASTTTNTRPWLQKDPLPAVIEDSEDEREASRRRGRVWELW